MRRALAAAPTLFRFGVGRVMQAMGVPDLPGNAGQQAAAFARQPPRLVPACAAEQAELPSAFAQAQALTILGDRPLVVLTAKANVDSKPGWATAQDQMAALSTNSRHTVADMDHVAFLHRPGRCRAVRDRHQRRRHRRPHPRRGGRPLTSSYPAVRETALEPPAPGHLTLPGDRRGPDATTLHRRRRPGERPATPGGPLRSQFVMDPSAKTHHAGRPADVPRATASSVSAQPGPSQAADLH